MGVDEGDAGGGLEVRSGEVGRGSRRGGVYCLDYGGGEDLSWFM